MKTENIQIDYVAVGTLRNYGKNAKTHSDAQIQQIARSIKEFGFNNPILIDESGEIIAGHGRYAAAKVIGLEMLPVIRLGHLTDTQKRAYRLADNKVAENGGWDENILRMELSEIELICNFDIQTTGFNTIEIDTLLDDKPKQPDIKMNAIPFIANDEIVSKVGDLWLIGNHKLLCGSSLDNACFERLMDGELADLISQDPPFNLSAKSIGSSGKTKHENFKMAAGEMSVAEFTKFWPIILNCARSTQSNQHYHISGWIGDISQKLCLPAKKRLVNLSTFVSGLNHPAVWGRCIDRNMNFVSCFVMVTKAI
jgi:hypothetical protein